MRVENRIKKKKKGGGKKSKEWNYSFIPLKTRLQTISISNGLRRTIPFSNCNDEINRAH